MVRDDLSTAGLSSETPRAPCTPVLHSLHLRVHSPHLRLIKIKCCFILPGPLSNIYIYIYIYTHIFLFFLTNYLYKEHDEPM